MAKTQIKTQANINASPPESSGNTKNITIDGKKYTIIWFQSIRKGATLKQSMELAEVYQMKMLTIDDAKAFIDTDQKAGRELRSAIADQDYTHIRDPEYEANSRVSFLGVKTTGELSVFTDSLESLKAPMLILKMNDTPQPQAHDNQPLNFPTSKTDPKRWKALKRDLGILADGDYLLRAEALYDKISHDVPTDLRVHAMLIVLAAALGRKDDAERLYEELPDHIKAGSSNSAEVCICNLVMGRLGELQIQGILKGWELLAASSSRYQKEHSPNAAHALFAFLGGDEMTALEWFVSIIKLYHGENTGNALEGLVMHAIGIAKRVKWYEVALDDLMRKDPEPKGKGPERELEYIYTCLWLAVAGGVDLKELIPKDDGVTRMTFAVRKG